MLESGTTGFTGTTTPGTTPPPCPETGEGDFPDPRMFENNGSRLTLLITWGFIVCIMQAESAPSSTCAV